MRANFSELVNKPFVFYNFHFAIKNSKKTAENLDILTMDGAFSSAIGVTN